MAAPANKRTAKRPGTGRASKGRTEEVEQKDADLRAFRAMSEMSRRATSKELDQLIRPAK